MQELNNSTGDQVKQVRQDKMRSIGIIIMLFIIALVAYGMFLHDQLTVKAQNAFQTTQSTIQIAPENSQSKHNLNPHVKILDDPTGALELTDVKTSLYESQFTIHGERTAPSYSYTESAKWVKFKLQDASQEGDWLLEVGYPLLDQLDFYYPGEDGAYVNKKTGDALPFDSRDVEHRNFVFEIPPTWDEESPFFLRIETQSAMIFPLTLWEQNSFYEAASNSYLIFGIYYGVILIISFYSLFLFLFAKTNDYLYYLLFILSMGLFLFTFNGLSFQYIWPNNPWWAKNAINLFLFMGGFSSFLFANKILPVKEHIPILDKTLKIFCLFAGVMIPLTLIMDFSLAMQIGIVTVLMGPLIVLPAAVVCWYKGFQPAKYLLCGWSVFALGIILMASRSLGVLPDSFVTMYGAQIGFSVKIIFLFVGLADNMRILKTEKNQKEIENKKLELERQKLKHAETLNMLLQDITVSEDIKTISEKLLKHLEMVIPYNFACFLLKEENGFYCLSTNWPNSITGTDSSDQDKNYLTDGEKISDINSYERQPYTEELFFDVLDSGEPHLLEDVREKNAFKTYSPQQETQSAMIVPMISNEEKLGVLVLEKAPKQAFNRADTYMAMNFVSQASLAIENAKLFQEVNKLAVTDELTGLYNRRFFLQRGEEEFERAQRFNQSLSVIIMDLDNFKGVNDNYGHAVGDEVLRTVAQRCSENIRRVDIACRYGGEEFAFLLPETTSEGAYVIADRFRGLIAFNPIAAVKTNELIDITASLGVATQKEDMCCFDQVIDKADEALYEAKRAGKNRVATV